MMIILILLIWQYNFNKIILIVSDIPFLTHFRRNNQVKRRNFLSRFKFSNIYFSLGSQTWFVVGYLDVARVTLERGLVCGGTTHMVWGGET